MNEDIGLWLVSPGQNAKHWESFRENGIVSIPLIDIGDISLMESKDEFIEAYNLRYRSDLPKPTQRAHYSFKYVNEMEIGDVLFAKKGTKSIIGIGVVISDYTYVPKDKFPNQRRIKWLDGIDEIEFPEEMKMPNLALVNIRERNIIQIVEFIENHLEQNYNISLSEVIKLNSESNENKTNNDTDKIPFRYDRVLDHDELGREPVAIAFADLIMDDIFTDDLEHSFMVHLQGAWGAGKSTFMNLVKKSLNSRDTNWVVIEFNAWKNQHLSPPWWIFIDQIFRQTLPKVNIKTKVILSIKENLRRIIRYSSWQKLLSLLLSLVFIILLTLYGSDIASTLINSPNVSEKITETEKGLTILVLAKLFISLASVVGLVYSFSKFLATPFFLNTSEKARAFMSRASDPLKRIKNHFSSLIDDINKEHQLAIFIDDIDRCDKEFIVELLEGIQTLFKEKKVLYIVAGDKQWISTSFQNHYSEFLVESDAKSESLGDLFLEKAFQLSLRLPQISKPNKERYWRYILGLNIDSGKKPIALEDLDESSINQIEEELNENRNRLQEPEFMLEFEDKYNLSSDDVSNLVIKRKNRAKDEISHLLVGLSDNLSTNPRSIIRLANSYTMTRSTLIAERVNFEPEKLFRWVALKTIYSGLERTILDSKNTKELSELLNDQGLSDQILKHCFRLINGNQDSDLLTMADIRSFEGIDSVKEIDNE